MAANPELMYTDNNTIFGKEYFCEVAPPTTTCVGGGGPLWGEESLVPSLDDFGLLHHHLHYHHLHQPTTTTVYNSPSQYSSNHHHKAAIFMDPTSFPHQDMLALPPVLNIPASAEHHLYEFPDDYFPLVPEIKPFSHPLPPHNWETQSTQVPVAEDSNMKVSRYSEEVRKERILRYLKKRNQRNFNKTIKYACRKTLADKRIRVRGRFARNNEASDQQLNPTKNDHDPFIHKDTELLYNHDFNVQMKKDEEEWLQEITSLMYLPYISS